MSEYSWEADVTPEVDRFASIRWRNDPRREEKHADALSISWEFFQATRAGVPPKSIAWYAVLQAETGRQFHESARSLTGPKRSTAKPIREAFDARVIFHTGADPSEIVAFRELFELFFQSLDGRKRTIAELLAMGERTDDVAAKCGVSKGRISQIRRELESAWQVLGA